MLKKTILIIFMVILPIHVPSLAFANHPTDNLRAAFIRNHNLWIKQGTKERRVTDGENVRYPKWSHDGNWIAYLKGSKTEDEIVYDGELWLYNTKMNNHFKIKADVSHNFQWAPRDNKISFMVGKSLYMLHLVSAIPFLPIKIAGEIENFSWLPDGISLLTSAKESEQLHSNIVLSKITPGQNNPIIEHFYTIPVGKEEYFVSTSQFKWSFDRQWLSFLLIPTASLSADANTLCVLSRDGTVFRKVGEMLNEENWFHWAPSKNILGFISGIGREATIHKQFEMVHLPSFNEISLTPKGYVDRDFSWRGNERLYVSRSLGNQQTDMSKQPLPRIYEVPVTAGMNHQVTSPSINEGDFAPQFFRDLHIWIRTDRQSASVYVSPNEKEWINNMAVASSYYGRWNWDEVLSLDKGN